jgi:hypothetical protein
LITSPGPSRTGGRDRISSRTAATRDSSAWLLSSSPGIETGTELAVALHRLLAVLEPVAPELWDLVRAGYQANWFCIIASRAVEHAPNSTGDLRLEVFGDGLDCEDREGASLS